MPTKTTPAEESSVERLRELVESLAVHESGARHSSKDQASLQSIHDTACQLGATCASGPMGESATPASTDDAPLTERQFTAAERDKLAKSGAAMSGGEFPIETVADLENAIQAIGRAADPAAAKAHIKKRAAALGATDKLPADWKEAAQPADLAGDVVPLVESVDLTEVTPLIQEVAA